MDAVPRVATPGHLWLIGIVALLWNLIGAADYTMTRYGGEEYMLGAGMDAAGVAWIESAPAWATAGWALGVWGGVAGSLLLLLRSRFAVWAFALSLVGVLVMTAYAMANPYPASMTSTGATVFEWTIKVIALLLLLYAWAMRKRGVLR